MADLVCQCGCVEFMRLEVVTLNEANAPIDTQDLGFKCSNCGTMYRLEVDGTIQQASIVPQRRAAPPGTRVQSSVSARDRHGNSEPEKRQF